MHERVLEREMYMCLCAIYYPQWFVEGVCGGSLWREEGSFECMFHRMSTLYLCTLSGQSVCVSNSTCLYVLQVLRRVSVSESVLQTCYQFSLTARLAPKWNLLTCWLVQGQIHVWEQLDVWPMNEFVSTAFLHLRTWVFDNWKSSCNWWVLLSHIPQTLYMSVNPFPGLSCSTGIWEWV